MAFRPAQCHPDEPHHSNGLCEPCYDEWYEEYLRLIKLNPDPQKLPAHYRAMYVRPPRTCVNHPDRLQRARGLCSRCYGKWWLSQHPEEKPRLKQRKHSWYVRHGREKRREFARLHPKEHKENIFKHRLSMKYAMSPIDYRKLLEAQAGKCAICRQVYRRKLSVDHNHSTGNVRGLLCSPCNVALGFVERAGVTNIRQYLGDF